MKALVLAEKPSVGKDIARVLGCRQGANGYFEGKDYIVTWAMGHLVTLADPERYDEKYKKWELSELPILPQKTQLVIIGKTSKQFGIVKGLIGRKDVGEIIIATDAGREGELVARWILLKAGNKKPLKRLWISSVTDKAIREGFNRLKNGKEYENLYLSAVSRAEADWFVGINATRALTSKHNASLSCGRVQTPTLAMIAMRDEEIRNFRGEKYFGIEMLSGRTKFTWNDKNGSGHSFDEAKIDGIIAKIKGKEAVISSVDKVKKKAYSPALYDLTELQRDANKRYGYSAKETLSLMQSLYERHKVLTYPRTDSRYLTDDIVPTIPERLRALPREYRTLAAPLLRAQIRKNSSFVDNNKVSDHHAIIPTEQPVYYDDFTDKEKKIYDMVVKRFLSVLYPPYEYEQTTVKVLLEGEEFSVKGRVTLVKGYKEVSGRDAEQDEQMGVEQELPSFSKGQRLEVSRLNKTNGITKPPAHFNEATLLSAMENPSRLVSDNSLKKTLSQTGGLGTVATRADIIEKLFAGFLIEKKGKDIYITSKGKQLLSLAPADLKSPEMTGSWEQKLIKISEGKLDRNSFMAEIREYTKEIVKEISLSDASFRHDNLSSTKCPECGKLMLNINGKKGKMLVCQDRECGYRKSVSIVTNARCPQCHKKLELVGEGDGRRFVCSCGHNEKYSVFQERKKNENGKMDKRSVQRYLNNQNKQAEKEVNNPFGSLKDMF